MAGYLTPSVPQDVPQQKVQPVTQPVTTQSVEHEPGPDKQPLPNKTPKPPSADASVNFNIKPVKVNVPAPTSPSTGPISGSVGRASTVKGQMEDLLSENSKYIQIARKDGERVAARRGFLNSSVAAGEAELAAIRAATPIAQQDASTNFQQDRANQDWANKFSENDQIHGHRLGEIGAQGNIQAGIAAAENAARVELYKLQARDNLDLYTRQSADQTARDKYLAGEQAARDQRLNTFETDRIKLNEQLTGNRDRQLQDYERERDQTLFNQRQEEMRLASTLNKDYRANYLNDASRLNESFASQMASIYTNPNIKPEQIKSAEASLRAWYQSQSQWLQQSYQALGLIEFDIGAFTPGGGTTGPATTPPTTTPPNTPTTPGNPRTTPNRPGMPVREQPNYYSVGR